MVLECTEHVNRPTVNSQQSTGIALMADHLAKDAAKTKPVGPELLFATHNKKTATRREPNKLWEHTT